MGRFPQSVGKKGSKKWIQKLINEKSELLTQKIMEKLNLPDDEEIQWLSPLKEHQYEEYRDGEFIEKLDVELEKIPLVEFWPKGGPQWDALGRSSSGKLFLVEAKSHIREMISTIRAQGDSKKTIIKSLEETKQFLHSNADIDWSKGFYQYANRLAHLYLLRKNELMAYLVFVYFLNDSEMKGPTTVEEWNGATKLLHSFLGIERHKLQKYICSVFIDVKELNQ